MRAAIFHENGGPEVVRIEKLPRPVPGAGEVLLEVRAAALNHLDLWVRRGLPIETTMPHVGGSDVAGVVVEAGEGVDAARIGERVVLNPSLWCGECEWCRRGEESMCLRYRIIGEHTNGGFTEFLAVPPEAPSTSTSSPGWRRARECRARHAVMYDTGSAAASSNATESGRR